MGYPRFINGSAEKAAHLEWLKTQHYSDLLQKDRILKYIAEFGSITPLQAFKDLGIMRLGARVFELIEEGWQIFSEPVTGKNRFGDDTRYANYKMAA